VGVASAPLPNVFGKYSLVAKLATGGMAEIFLARLSGAAGFEKLVCVKRILPHLAKDQNLVGMFLSEAKIAAAISHHNVCQVFELGEIDGRYFIAMEYLEGVPFSCFRRRDMYPPPPDPRLVASLGMQACEGLHHAHQLTRTDGSLLEVVHRDVSSNNLFATVAGIVKVLDFGIAKVQDASVRTSTGSVKGTYAYMAPEQLRGEKLDRRTDVFAVGIVLWELFARKHLFKRDTDFLTFQAITTDPIPDISEFRPDVPPQLCATIAKALSRDREDRFPSARALGEELGRSVASVGGPLSASELSDVISTAFEARLADQRALIRIAREGGVLDLNDDLGPGVGHGTALVTTPVSMLSSPAVDAVPDETVRPSPSGPIPAALPRRTSTPNQAVRPSQLMATAGPRSQSFDAVTPPPPRRTNTIDVALPVAPVRSRIPWILFGLLFVGVGAAALYFFVWAAKDPAKTVTEDGSDRVVNVVATAKPPPAIDAAVTPTYNARPAVDAAEPVTPPIDAAAPVAIDAAPITPDAAKVTPEGPTRQHKDPPRPKVIKTKGPPGFITIDSKPVYAVIYIDGKRYGETPLPRISLSPGRHSVRAVSSSGTAQTTVITIESGKLAQTQRFRW